MNITTDAVTRSPENRRHGDEMERAKLFPIRMYLAVTALREREEGQAMVEYALIIALVSVAAFAVLTTIGTRVSIFLQTVNDDVP